MSNCILCGSPGESLYEGLDDVLFGAPGTWSFKRCANSRCQLIWLDPQPLEEDIGKAYATYYTHQDSAGGSSLPKRIYRQVRASYLRSRLGYETTSTSRAWRWLAPLGHLHPGGAGVFAAMVMFLPAPRSTSTLLDVGCGGGDFIAMMRELGWTVAGVETDPIAAARAQSRGLNVHQGALQTAAFEEKTFDAITIAHVVEHVHDPQGMLAQCRRILNPQGTIVITTPNSASWGHRHYGRDWRGLEPPRHLHLFNRQNMRRLLEWTELRPRVVETLALNTSAIWPASAAIRRSRSSAASTRWRVGLATTASGVGRQLAERLMLNVDRSAGEDLVAIATRPA
ncbi:MAG: class I SAM-dependent methyltransferase [Chloroflexi bacterium]|nr:MAG: class I SAM-dependent methyltransferase [Chloroflexota bacterium]